MYIYVYIYKAIMRLLHQTFYVIKDLIIIIIKRWIIFSFDKYTVVLNLKKVPSYKGLNQILFLKFLVPIEGPDAKFQIAICSPKFVHLGKGKVRKMSS